MIIYNKKNCCHSIAGVIFIPGMNKISKETFEALKAHSVFMSLLKANAFKIVKDPDMTAEEIAKEMGILKDPVLKEAGTTKEKIIKELAPKEAKGSLNKSEIGTEEVKKETKETLKKLEPKEKKSKG